jgi:hypothetical protein
VLSQNMITRTTGWSFDPRSVHACPGCDQDNSNAIKIIKTNKEFLFCIYLSAIKKVYLNQHVLGEEFGNNVSIKQKQIHQPDHHRDFNQGLISGV